MSKHNEQFQIHAPLDEAIRSCDRAAADLTPQVAWQRSGAGSAAGTYLGGGSAFANPATVQVVLIENAGAVTVQLRGSNFGFGPLQTSHVRDTVQGFRARIEACAAAQPSDPSPPRRDEPEPEQHEPEPARADPADAPRRNRIFISYRRDDSGYVTDQISDHLCDAFGRPAIFKDVDSIPPGVNFRKYLQRAVEQCDVLLAVVGTDWLGDLDGEGRHRIHDPTDFVRIEIEVALRREIPLIPILVRDASMPRADLLPDDLRDFVYQNAMKVRRKPDFDADIERLRKTVSSILGS